MPKSATCAVAPLCPSAQPEMNESVIFGIVGGTANKPQVIYLEEPQPVTPAILLLAEPVKPTEVFRFAAACQGCFCQHFDGQDCRLVTKIVQLLPAVSEDLPLCRLRPNCRWWQQEGKAACVHCPQIVTEVCQASDLLATAADPTYG